jgi:hypothetical protein
LDRDLGGSHVKPEGNCILNVREDAVGGSAGDVAPEFVERCVGEFDSETEGRTMDAARISEGKGTKVIYR